MIKHNNYVKTKLRADRGRCGNGWYTLSCLVNDARRSPLDIAELPLPIIKLLD